MYGCVSYKVCEERGVNTGFGREILPASSIGSLHSGIPLNDCKLSNPCKGISVSRLCLLA